MEKTYRQNRIFTFEKSVYSSEKITFAFITQIVLSECRKKSNGSIGTAVFTLSYILRNETKILHFLWLKVDKSDFIKTWSHDDDDDDRFDILLIVFRDEEILNKKTDFSLYYLILSNYFIENIWLNRNFVYG